jgi:PAS domain S-box-containing protein
MSKPDEDSAEIERLRARVAELEARSATQQTLIQRLESEALHCRAALQASPEHILTVSRAGEILFINVVGEGLTREQVIGSDHLQFTAPEHRKALAAARERTFATGESTYLDIQDVERKHWYAISIGKIANLDEVVIVSHVIDEQKRVELELLDARELWKSLTANSPDIILLLDRAGYVLAMNRTIEGYSPEEVIGRDGMEFVLPEYREALRTAVTTAVDKGAPQFFEMRDVRLQAWWWVNIVPVRNSERQDLVLAISSDVTQHRRAEHALRESKTRLRMLLDQAPAIMWTVDQDLRILTVDGAGLAASGLLPESCVGRTMWEYYGTDDVDLPPIAAHRAALSGESRAYEQHIGDLDFQKHVQPLRDHEGKIVGVVGVGIDVTNRKAIEVETRRHRDELESRVEERTSELAAVNEQLRRDIAARERVERELRESEERFRIIAEAVPVGVVITRRDDGRVLYVNRRVVGMFGGNSAEEFLGRMSTEFYVYPDERDRLLAKLESEEQLSDLEVWVKRVDGSKLLVSGSFQPILFDDTPSFLIGFIDVTRRIETERMLRSERRLLKRLLELHERDRQLIAYEVHDGIVQDMTASLMFLESSRPADLPLDDPTQENYETAARLLRGSIQEARRLINGLRPPVLEDEGVVAALESFIGELTETSGIEVEFISEVKFQRLAPALEMAIYRIVQEALNNVWHHSRSRRAKLNLTQRDDMIEIVVQDWGIGFEPAKVAKRRYGLVGVRERARLLNGHATIESVPNEGTTVRVELPLVDALMPTAE